MASIIEKAAMILERTPVVMIASLTEDGYPRVVPVSKLEADGIGSIWFATGADAEKARNFRTNPKAGLCFYENSDSVGLTGRIEIVDGSRKKEIWQDWMLDHFPGGPEDPNYCLLCFKPEQGTFWIDGNFVKLDL